MKNNYKMGKSEDEALSHELIIAVRRVNRSKNIDDGKKKQKKTPHFRRT